MLYNYKKVKRELSREGTLMVKDERKEQKRDFQEACKDGDENKAKSILEKFQPHEWLDFISPQPTRSRDSYHGLKLAFYNKQLDVARAVLDTAASRMHEYGLSKSLLPYATRLGHVELVKKILNDSTSEEISNILTAKDVKGNLTSRTLKWGFRENRDESLNLILEKVINPMNTACDFELLKVVFPYACGLGKENLVKNILENTTNEKLMDLLRPEEYYLGLTHAFNAEQWDTIKMTLTTILQRPKCLNTLAAIFVHTCRLGDVEILKAILNELKAKDLLILLDATDNHGKSGMDWVLENQRKNGKHSRREEVLRADKLASNTENNNEEKDNVMDVICNHMYNTLEKLQETEVVKLYQKLLPVVITGGYEKQVKLMLQNLNVSKHNMSFIFLSILIESDMNSYPPLHVVCREGTPNIAKSVLEYLSDYDKELFEKAILLRDNRENRIPLHWACKSGDAEVVQILLEHTTKIKNGVILEKCMQEKDRSKCTALFWACMDGHDQIVKLLLNCLKDVEGLPDVAKINKNLYTRNMDEKTCIHGACENGFDGVVDIILNTMEDNNNVNQFNGDVSVADNDTKSLPNESTNSNQETFQLLQRGKSINDNLQNALELKDNLGMTPLHWASENNNTQILLDLIRRGAHRNASINLAKLVTIQDQLEKTMVHSLSANGNAEALRELTGYLRSNGVNKENKNPFLIKDCNGSTALHATILPGYMEITKDQMETTKAIVEFLDEKDQLVSALKMQNKRKETPLHLACRYDQVETVIALTENLSAEEMKEVLCITDHRGNYPFGLAEKELINKVIEKEKERDVQNDKQAKHKYIELRKKRDVSICLTIMAQMNKFGNSYFDDDENTDRIIKILEDHMKKKLVDANNSLSLTYPDFYGHKQQAIPYAKAMANHPLTIIGNTGNLLIIKHPYIYFYVHTLWKSFVRYICWANIFLYFVFLFFMCSFVTTYNFYDLQSGEDESITTRNASMHSSQQARTTELDYEVTSKVYSEISRWGMVALALAGLLFEGVQLKTKRSQYWAYKENFTDLFIFVAALVLAILPLTIGYNPWIHSFGSFLIICATINTTWMLTKVPKFGNYFLMLLSVLTKVLMFTPVLALFIVTYAIVFHNLLRNQSSFENLGLSILKVMAMSIGELEYGDLFLEKDNYTVFEIVSMIVFVLFLFVMTISMMALLIGVAVGDINELNKQGEQISFQSQVDLILQYAYMFPRLNKIRHEKEIYRLQYMRQKYTSQLDDQHRSFLDNLEKHYKRFQTLARADGIVTEHEVRQIMKDELNAALKDIKKERNKEQGDHSSLQLQIKELSEMLEKQSLAMQAAKPYKEESDC